MAAHKHAEVIKAWADGAEIQVRDEEEWRDVAKPNWHEENEYRIKPAEPEYVYPVTMMTGTELSAIYEINKDTLRLAYPLRAVANAALRHACDAGQVVTREEFDRMCADRKARDMAVAKHVHDEIFRLAAIKNGSGVRITSSLSVEKLLKGMEL